MATLNARQIIDDIRANDYDALTDWLEDGNVRINRLGDINVWYHQDEVELDEIIASDVGDEVIYFIRDYALSSGRPTKWDP